MTRDWKPGDVATVDGTPLTFFENDDTSELMFTNGSGYQHPARHLSAKARPLVVIDLEDRERVSRLTRALKGQAFHEEVQAALRSLLAPPKPDEPTGLGAVVEDDRGDRWIRRDADRPWVSAQGKTFPCEWTSLTAVRVLSEGVTA